MKKIITGIIVFSCMFFYTYTCSTFAEPNNSNFEKNNQYSENEIIVLTEYYVASENYNNCNDMTFHGVEIIGIEPLFDDSTSENIDTYAVNSGNCFPYILTLPDGSDLNATVDTLKDSTQIIAVDKNYYLNIEWDEPITSNSRSSNLDQWAIDEEHLNIEAVWAKGFTGSSNTVVAVIDGGFNTSHEDVSFDLLNAYDFADEDEDVNTYSSDNNHGTGISGIIGANPDNNLGIQGICKNVSILPVRAPQINDFSTFSKTLSHAIQAGAKVVNCSFAVPFTFDNPLMYHALIRSQVLVVFSAGNWGSTNPAVISGGDMQHIYSTIGVRTDSDYIMVVGASNIYNQKWVGSNYSSVYCDLFAPGENIIMPGNTGYYVDSGTSFAVPHVVAACALIKSTATHLTVPEIRELLLDNVTPVEGFDSYCVSGGILSITDTIDAIYDSNRGAYTRGDINGDGRITTADKNLCNEIASGTYNATDIQFDAADLNDDGVVNSIDIIPLIRYCNKTFYFTP